MEDHTTPENNVSHAQREFLKLNPIQQQAVMNMMRLLAASQGDSARTPPLLLSNRIFVKLTFWRGFLIGVLAGMGLFWVISSLVPVAGVA